MVAIFPQESTLLPAETANELETPCVCAYQSDQPKPLGVIARWLAGAQNTACWSMTKELKSEIHQLTVLSLNSFSFIEDEEIDFNWGLLWPSTSTPQPSTSIPQDGECSIYVFILNCERNDPSRVRWVTAQHWKENSTTKTSAISTLVHPSTHGQADDQEQDQHRDTKAQPQKLA